MKPVWVKICGMTDPSDVEAAIRAGADAIGLVTVARSPRRLNPQRASELATIAHGRVQVVALVEGDVESAMATAGRIGADMVQPYGPDASVIASAAIEAGLEALLPVPVAAEAPIDVSAVPLGARPLLDTAIAGRTGGTGQAFDWSRARAVSGAVVAGGLNPTNVARAVIAARPWGVDASSGLEAAVGRKDHGKVSSFIKAAKSA